MTIKWKGVFGHLRFWRFEMRQARRMGWREWWRRTKPYLWERG